MIRTKNTTINSPNFIDHNETVTEDTVKYNRPAGCYVSQNDRGFLFDGGYYDEYVSALLTYRHTCVNGDMQSRAIYNWWQQNYPQFHPLIRP